MKKLSHSILIVAIFLLSLSSLLKTTNSSERFIRGGEEKDSSNKPSEWDPYLPGNLRPLKYDVEIVSHVHDSRSMFEGKVLITVKCLRSTNKIILHEKSLNILEDDVKIKLSGTDPPSFIRIKKHEYDTDHDKYIIILRETLEENKNYEIQIEYVRDSKDNQQQGYFFLQYQDPKTANTVHKYLNFIDFSSTKLPEYRDQRVIGFTLMGDVGARRVFPCFDQLGMKATFKIRLSHETTMKGLSNAEKISTLPVSDPSSFIEDTFTETFPMEANSVAIFLRNSSWKKLTYSITDVKIRTFVDDCCFEKLRLNSIIRMAAKIFRFLSDYLKVSYPFKKLDIIFLPLFHSKPETSYGVIYMSDERIWNSSEQTSNSADYRLVSELCHTISEQWIGHTVTVSQKIDNWIHIALNIFLQTQCVIHMEPNWEQNFIEPDNINSFMNLSETHPKETADSFLIMGDAPIYLSDVFNKNLRKAYHLTRMIHFFLGDDIFQRGINDYLEKYKFSNSNFGDLWTTFTNTAHTIQPHLLPNISVGEIMTSWIYQWGYPLITVTWKREKKQIFISQVPFNVIGEQISEVYKSCWLIPLSYTTKTESKSKIDTSVREWLTCADLHLKIEMKEDDWFLLDLRVNVIGRVNYDESIWIAIQKSLVNNEEPDVFHAFTRARLISDMFVLAEMGNLSYTIVLDAMKYLPQENQYENWTLALREFDKIRSLLLRSSVYESFEKYVHDILESIFQRKDYQNLTVNAGEDSNLKIAISESSCRYGVVACLQKNLQLIEKWKRGEEKLDSIPLDLLKTLHCQGIRYGNIGHWNFVWELYKKETNSSLGHTYFWALGCSQRKKIIKRLLKWSLDPKKFTPGESYSMIESLSLNRRANKLLRTFFINNFERNSESWKKRTDIYAHFMRELFNTTAKKEDLEQLLKFEDSHGLKEISYVGLQESRIQAENNVAWLQRNEKTFENYFQSSTTRKRWGFF